MSFEEYCRQYPIRKQEEENKNEEPKKNEKKNKKKQNHETKKDKKKKSKQKNNLETIDEEQGQNMFLVGSMSNTLIMQIHCTLQIFWFQKKFKLQSISKTPECGTQNS